MASKLDRWKNISKSTSQTKRNPNKAQIVEDLASIPDDKTGDTGEQDTSKDVDSGNPPVETEGDTTTTQVKDKKEVGVKSKNNSSTPKVGVQNKSNKPTTNKKESKKPVDTFTTKVNTAVREYIENKQTKDDTHKKTSFLIRLDLLAKLDNFDIAHGGRIKGEFLNNLLEEAFTELEQIPEWKEILNKDLEQNIQRISRRR